MYYLIITTYISFFERHTMTVWDSLLAEHQTHDRKVVSSKPGISGRRIFFSRVNFVCCSTPILPQWQ